jgi:hypothetical protein
MRSVAKLLVVLTALLMPVGPAERTVWSVPNLPFNRAVPLLPV